MDEPEESLVHGLEQPARCLRAVVAQQDVVQFLIGTQSLRSVNEVCVLDVEEEGASATKCSYVHAAGEIWHLAPHPNRPDVFASCHSAVKDGRLASGCSVWRLPQSNDSAAVSNGSMSDGGGGMAQTASNGAGSNGQVKRKLERLCGYECDESDARSSDSTPCFEWEPGGGGLALLVHAQNKISTVDIDIGSTAFPALTPTNWSSSGDGKGSANHGIGGKVHSAVWEPYPGSKCIVAAVDAGIRAYDLRANGPSASIENAHAVSVRCVDLNPNRPHVVASGGDDGHVRLWDMRNAGARPLATIAEHSHWVWSVRFNPVHDQLLLSASSDGLLILHSIASHSSDCVGVCGPARSAVGDSALSDEKATKADVDAGDAEQPGGGRLADGVLRRHESHEESVYACDWSPADPWRYASLSYHGRVIVDAVGRPLKYAILNVD